MDLNNVKIGNKFTTISKLHKQLGLPNVKGKQRQIQDKEVARWIDFELTNSNKRAKNEIVITAIRENPTEKVDGRIYNKGGNNSKYAEYIDQLVIDMLVRNNGSICDGKNNIIVEQLGIVNDNYLKYNKNHTLIASECKVAEFTASQYMMQINSILSGMFEGSLKRLAKTGAIWYEKTFMLKINKCDDTLANEYDKNFHDTIVEIENKVLEEMECTKRDLIFNEELRIDFYNEVNLTLQIDTNNEVWGYYSVYNIHLLQDESSFASIDREACARALTKELLLASHKSLAKKKSSNDTQIWMTEKLSTFVVMFEKKIFKYPNQDMAHRDLFVFSAAKIRIIHEKSKVVQEYQEECNEICTY